VFSSVYVLSYICKSPSLYIVIRHYKYMDLLRERREDPLRDQVYLSASQCHLTLRYVSELVPHRLPPFYSLVRFTLAPFWVRIRTPGHGFVNADTNQKNNGSFNPRPTGPFVGSDDEEDFLFAAADHVAED
jgi:hypothetical protein